MTFVLLFRTSVQQSEPESRSKLMTFVFLFRTSVPQSEPNLHRSTPLIPKRILLKELHYSKVNQM
jgi:hypothetical protein